MKTMYYVTAEDHGAFYDIFDIGLYDSREEAYAAAKADREHLTRMELPKESHYIQELRKVPDDVETLEQLQDAVEEDISILEAQEVWTVLTDAECQELAMTLDWDPTDKEDTLDSLRTNWEIDMAEECVVKVYDELVKIWEQNYEEDEEE